MSLKEKIRKISEYEWELPKEAKPGMRVPGRLFLSEKLLKEVEEGAIEQVANVAFLPGIQKWSIAMPDMHFGYGFCLHPDTKILTEFGYYIKIKDLKKNWENVNVKCLNLKNKEVEDTSIIRFFKLKSKEIFRVLTEDGYEILATEDHPFLTPKGMVQLKDLKVGDKIAIYPFEGVHYEEPSNEVIVSKKDIENVVKEIEKIGKRTKIEMIISSLKRRKLLPLTYDNPKLPYLLKILGFIFGDATMNFIGKKKDGIISFSSKNKKDLEKIRSDILKIGYNASKIYKRISRLKYKGKKKKYVSYFFYVNSSSLLILLRALGAPIGKKVFQEYRVPKWIFKAPLWQKRLFLASYFGAELRKPYAQKNSKKLVCPTLSMNKCEELIENGKEFLRDVAKLLEEFGVKCIGINQRRRYRRKDGKITWHLELIISSEFKSLINLYSRIGFEYNSLRSLLANYAIIYLKKKERIWNEKLNLVSYEIPSLLNQGLSYNKIASLLSSEFITPRFIIEACKRVKNEEKYKAVKISHNFPSFESLVKLLSIIWNKVIRIEKIEYNGYVYDFTVTHKDHNFIANNFIVSNCIGGVAAISYEEGGISPGGVGLALRSLKAPKSI
jgi:tRNA-splicing ligase RtcB